MEAKNALASFSGQKLEGGAEISKSIGGRIGNFGKQTREHTSSAIHELDSLGRGTGKLVKGNAGGGDLVIPRERSYEPVTKERPLTHYPCIIEKKVHGKVFHTYGTLLDPRTNPLAMQREGYTEID